MNYLIKKGRNDTRNNTCGVYLPDGFFRVINLTLQNRHRIEGVRDYGYGLFETDMAPGLYEEQTNLPVEEGSVVIARAPENIGKGIEIRYLNDERDQKEPARIQEDAHPSGAAGVGTDAEVAKLRADLDSLGITYHPSAKAPALRKKLESAALEALE